MTTGTRHPEYTKLFVAVIDGEDPKVWRPFKKTFPELAADAFRTSPYGVDDDLIARFKVELEAILLSPADLLRERHLDKIVGVVIDALKQDSADDDFFDRKLGTLRALCREQATFEKPLFSRFGYRVWFVANDPTAVPFRRFVFQVREAFAARMKGAPVDFQFINEEHMLASTVGAYLSHAYHVLEFGN